MYIFIRVVLVVCCAILIADLLKVIVDAYPADIPFDAIAALVVLVCLALYAIIINDQRKTRF